MEDSIYDKFKNAFTEDPPKPKVVNRDLDPNKAKAFMAGFSGESSEDDAMTRRMKQLKQTK